MQQTNFCLDAHTKKGFMSPVSFVWFVWWNRGSRNVSFSVSLCDVMEWLLSMRIREIFPGCSCIPNCNDLSVSLPNAKSREDYWMLVCVCKNYERKHRQGYWLAEQHTKFPNKSVWVTHWPECHLQQKNYQALWLCLSLSVYVVWLLVFVLCWKTLEKLTY